MVTKRWQGQQSFPVMTTAVRAQKPEKNNATDTNIVGCISYFTYLLDIGQMLYGQTSGVVECICQEVAHITQGCAQLHLLMDSVKGKRAPSPIGFAFPVQFRDLIYGTLFVAPDPSEPKSPLLPRAIAYAIAQVCGLLLYTLEVSAFVQVRSYPRDQQVSRSLTRRQCEVLVLMTHGYSDEAIAEKLTITPATVDKHRQHIYERLDVHSSHDALLAAYQRGLFSPLQEISPKH